MTALAVEHILSEVEARDLTVQIKSAAEQVWSLLLVAHERRAWSALGYNTWAAYVQTEFDMSRSQSYYLIDQAKIIREIGRVVPVSTNVDITEKQARDIKPVLDTVIRNVEDRVAEIIAAQAAEPAQELIEQAVQQEIQRGRDLAADMANRAKRADPAMAAVIAAIPEDFDADEDARRINALGAIRAAVEEISELTYAPQFIADWMHSAHLESFAKIRAVVTFLSNFADAVEARA